MIILGIETSCDETGISLVTADKNSLHVLSNVVASSMELHSKTGGIIPEIAAREQIKYILPVLDEALKDAEVSKDKIDAIAVTVGPGLIGSLLVGVETARTLAYVWDKPLIPVNHLFGHIYANFLEEEANYSSSKQSESRSLNGDSSRLRSNNIEFPAIALIVSGGHTDLVFMENENSVKWIAGTRDDAAGEAYDKIGRLLGLSYPAGPLIEQLAKKGTPNDFHFPRPLLHEDTLDFSFSGLKTAVLREVQRHSDKLGASASKISSENPKEHRDFGVANAPQNDELFEDKLIADLARATQDAIIDVLVEKTMRATLTRNAKSVLLCGGVAANQTLRDHFLTACEKYNINFFVPSRRLCTDNGAMIAAAGYFTPERIGWKEITANPELYFD